MKEMSEVAKDMTKAIEYMNDHGWCKNAFKNDKHEVCIFGGFMYSHSDINKLFKATSSAIEELWPGRKGRGGVTTFNDHPDTTRIDVDKVMERALSIIIQEDMKMEK